MVLAESISATACMISDTCVIAHLYRTFKTNSQFTPQRTAVQVSVAFWSEALGSHAFESLRWIPALKFSAFEASHETGWNCHLLSSAEHLQIHFSSLIFSFWGIFLERLSFGRHPADARLTVSHFWKQLKKCRSESATAFSAFPN